MATFEYFRQCNLSTTVLDENILLHPNVIAIIRERFGGITEQAYLDKLNTTGIPDMYFQIFGSGFSISVNNEAYEPLLDESVWTSSDFVRKGIKSIRISVVSSNIQFRFNIL